jgi:hypothetical protein
MIGGAKSVVGRARSGVGSMGSAVGSTRSDIGWAKRGIGGAKSGIGSVRSSFEGEEAARGRVGHAGLQGGPVAPIPLFPLDRTGRARSAEAEGSRKELEKWRVWKPGETTRDGATDLDAMESEEHPPTRPNLFPDEDLAQRGPTGVRSFSGQVGGHIISDEDLARCWFAGDQPLASRTAGDRPFASWMAGDQQFAGDRSVDSRTAGEQPFASRTAGGQPFVGDQPWPEISPFPKVSREALGFRRCEALEKITEKW